MKWEALDRPQRIGTLLGLIGSFGAASGIFIATDFNPLSLVAFLPLLVPLLGSLSLLYIPMSDESRGVVGFLTLLASLAPLFFLTLLLLRLVFPHRDTPTGL